MGEFYFIRVLLLSVFLVTLVSNGFSREMADYYGRELEVANPSVEQMNLREIELDYEYAGPNFNSKSSFILPPAAPPPGLGF